MIEKWYAYRFEFFFSTQLLILFGALIIPIAWFEHWIMPVLMLSNIAAGILLVKRKKLLFRALIAIFMLVIIALSLDFIDIVQADSSINYFKLASYFAFYALVTVEIIHQVWKAKVVGKNVILGLISGYLSIGLLAFFLCLTIEITHPGSFSGLITGSDANTDMPQQLMYYSYITLMTIGYGDILPITATAQKAAVFIGLIGQFYLVILTAVVVGKYISQTSRTKN